MKIGVLGTGNVGQTIGAKLAGLGHQVMMGSRTKDNEKALAFVEKTGNGAGAGTFEEVCEFAELIFNCTAGIHSLAVFLGVGEKHLAGKVILDLSNPLDFSKGLPPTLSVCNTDSIGEQIQTAFPKALVVKTLNTMWCGLMVNPNLVANGEHHVFVSGNEEKAKQSAKEILQSFGWKPQNIIDLGDISAARGTEMYLPLWLKIYGAEKIGAFNIRIVK